MYFAKIFFIIGAAMGVDPKFHLVKAIVSSLVFFEFSEEDAVNPDIAIQAVENITAELQQWIKMGKLIFAHNCKLSQQVIPAMRQCLLMSWVRRSAFFDVCSKQIALPHVVGKNWLIKS